MILMWDITQRGSGGKNMASISEKSKLMVADVVEQLFVDII